jgi:hypothetical protein
MRGYVQAKPAAARQKSAAPEPRTEAAAGPTASARESVHAEWSNHRVETTSLVQTPPALDRRPGVQSRLTLQHALNRQQAPAQTRPNATGLPDRLKAGVEHLSGFAMDDVRVHYNSRRPAALQALAYTQGTDIHVGPGHERHLPHEAWHVVQQKQGRVKPTLQTKGVWINDHAGLETEADAMGTKAKGVNLPLREAGAAGGSGGETAVPAPGGAASVVQLEREVKKLSDGEAKDEWLKYQKQTYTMSVKFQGDHVLPAVTKSTALQASKERFVKDGKPKQPSARWNSMTWTEATDQNLLNKAGGAQSTNKRANIHSNKQQLTTKLKNIKKRTVRPFELDYKAANQMDEGDYETYKDTKEENVYVQFNVSGETTEEMNVVGGWKPETGDADMYHYEQKWPGANAMLPEYLEWVYDTDESDKPLGPKMVMGDVKE